MGALVSFLHEYQKQLTGYETLPKEITDRFEMDACLKETDQKQVYVIRSKSGNGKYILKCVTGESQERLEEEYRLEEKLSHEGIAKPTEIICKEDCTYLLREYIQGSTITELVEMSSEGRLSPKEILDISLQLCDILDYLHTQTPPIIHRDIKPDNIIITKKGKCILIDFGISRQIHTQNERDTIIMGTKYMAPPEQYGFRQTDARSDIYSLGILIFYMATGCLDINELSRYPLPMGIKKCIKKCTSFSPEDRFSSAMKLKSFLKRERYLMEKDIKKSFLRIAVLIMACTGTFILTYYGFLGGKSPKQTDSISPPITGSGADHKAQLGQSMINSFDNTLVLNHPVVSQTVQPDSTSMGTDDSSVYHFTSSLIEAAVRQQLGKSDEEKITIGDLKQVRELFICGKQVYKNWDEHMGFGTNQLMSDEEYTSTMLYNQRGDIKSIEDLAYMPNIKTLALYYQNIVDITPLQNLTKLVTLGLGTNKIYNLDPIKNMTRLTILDVAGNPVSDEEIYKISSLPYLQNLDVSATEVTDLKEFSSMKLVSLSMMEDKLWNCDGIEKLANLKSLMISGVNKSVTEEGLNNICKLSGMEDLSIFDGSKIDLSVFTRMSSLTRLVLCGVPVDDISGLADMKLSSLDLTGTRVSNLSPLKDMPSLSYLNLKSIPCKDYSVLTSLPYLNTVECTNLQKLQMKEQLGGKALFQISVTDYGK